MPTQRARWSLALLAIGAPAAAALWWWQQPAPRHFVTAPVEQGDLVRAIVTTGTVNPVVVVQVGTYVSGVIEKLACDFNTAVVAGQLCAKIDPRPFQVAVDQARANLTAAQAQLLKDRANLAYAKLVYQRNSDLVGEGAVSREEVDASKNELDQAAAQVEVDEATILQRRAALEAAQVDLDYTDIVSPVDGIVVSRSVDVGQTVAASFQTPTLFLIAQDLTKMQVDTNVSESDVGGARVGQRATFTVEAFPGRRFTGRVEQLRQAPITVQNVVTYNVVVSVDNPELLLLPGMTANVSIVTDERHGVRIVPVRALRFEPQGPTSGGTAPPGDRRVWVLRDGRPHPVPVEVGIDDGVSAEIAGGELQAGAEVIVDETGGDAKPAAARRPSFL